MTEPADRQTVFGTIRRARKQRIAGYIPGNSFLHALDPRTKIVGLIVVTAASFLASAPLPMIIPFLFVIVLAIACGLLKMLCRGYLFFIPLIIAVLILDSFFANEPSGTVYFSAQLGILHPVLTSDRINFAIAMVMRLLTIGGFSLLFVMTTEYTKFVNALKSLKIPTTVAFSLGYALRSVTGLSNDLHHIMNSQRSRGLEFDKNTLVKGRNTLMAVTIPMAVSVIRRSQHVSDAMQSRGFGGPMIPTMYHPSRFGRNDGIMLAAYTILIAVVLVIR